MAQKIFRRFAKDRSANVAIIFGLAALPALFLVGMVIDYTMATDRQTQLNSDADAAALAAVTPSMMAQSATAAATAATDVFNAQASNVSGVNYNSSTGVKVTIATSGTKRTATVAYTAQSQNFFANILGSPTIAIAGLSQATAGMAPNIDFYLLLDSSPSMAIAATQAGINTMVSNTPTQGGCAFACHQSNPAPDNLGNPGGVDNYQLARDLKVTLRIDLLRQAAQDLMDEAQKIENANAANYRMAIYTFDTDFNPIAPLTSNLGAAKTQAGNINMLQVYSNNYLTASNNNNDTDTDYDTAMKSIDAAMPNPGSGTAAKGDTPQEVLFFVTDGVEDEKTASGGRQLSVMDNGWCTTIKNRGIRIAVLYTTYLPLPTNPFYNNNVAAFQPDIAPTLQACASPGLYYEVQTGGDVSAALLSLFQRAVQSAFLSK